MNDSSMDNCMYNNMSNSNNGNSANMSSYDTISSMFDFTSLDSMDPSLHEGYRIIYEREVPLEVRSPVSYDGDIHSISPSYIFSSRQNITEQIKVKLLIAGNNHDIPQSVKLELSSETDLFFHYMHVIDINTFQSIRSDQKLMVDFNDYANILIRMLNSCIREPSVHIGIFVLLNDNDARLDFIQNMEYKYVELMCINFQSSPADVVQHHITYRYNTVKSKLTIMQSRLHEMSTLVKIKNPSLLLQLQKSSSSSIASGSNSINNSLVSSSNDNRRR